MLHFHKKKLFYIILQTLVKDKRKSTMNLHEYLRKILKLQTLVGLCFQQHLLEIPFQFLILTCWILR